MADWQERLCAALGSTEPSTLGWQERIIGLIADSTTVADDPGLPWQDRMVALLGGTSLTRDWQERIIDAAGGTTVEGAWQDRMAAAFEAWAAE